MICKIHTKSVSRTCKGCPRANQKKAQRAGRSSLVEHLPCLHVALPACGPGRDPQHRKNKRKLQPPWARPCLKIKTRKGWDVAQRRTARGLIGRTKTKTKTNPPTRLPAASLWAPSWQAGVWLHRSLVRCQKTARADSRKIPQGGSARQRPTVADPWSPSSTDQKVDRKSVV